MTQHTVHILSCTECGKQLAFSWKPFLEAEHAKCYDCMLLICEVGHSLYMDDGLDYKGLLHNSGLDLSKGITWKEIAQARYANGQLHIIRSRARERLRGETAKKVNQLQAKKPLDK